MVVSMSTVVVQYTRCLHRYHEPITVERSRRYAGRRVTSPIRVLRRSWCCVLGCNRHLLHLSGDVGGPTQATVLSRSWNSVRDVAHFPAQSRNHVHGNHVAVSTVCDEQWK